MEIKKDLKKIAVVGAGGWGTALSIILAGNFSDVLLWTRNDDLAKEINIHHSNTKYLPPAKLPSNIYSSTDSKILKDFDIIVNSVPTQYIRDYYNKYNLDISDKYIINSSKGIENKTDKTISGIFSDEYSIDLENYAILTGPSHAEEVCVKVPTTVVAASKNLDFAKQVQKYFTSDSFRVYSSHDYLGCEIGGALKNVIAIAAGIIDGMELGDNTKAALITRGLAEIARLGEKMGAEHQTFSGLSGLGDLFVTCSSRHSRNRKFGELIGQGKKAEKILDDETSIAEGVYTAKSAYQLSNNLEIDMPITQQVYKIIYESKLPGQAIDDLMNRDNKHEWY